MKLDTLIQALLPHNEKFYNYFEKIADLLIEATIVYKKIPTCKIEEREKLCREIDALEKLADNVTHEIKSELSSTFVTPFDREDIHELATSLDDVMDFIEGSSKRFLLYDIGECPEEISELINVLDLSVNEIKKGVLMLRDFRDPDLFNQVIQKINEYENQADNIFNNIIKKLMTDGTDILTIIKLKEIIVGLETATDKCEDVANIFESILIKHN